MKYFGLIQGSLKWLKVKKTWLSLRMSVNFHFAQSCVLFFFSCAFYSSMQHSTHGHVKCKLPHLRIQRYLLKPLTSISELLIATLSISQRGFRLGCETGLCIGTLSHPSNSTLNLSALDPKPHDRNWDRGEKRWKISFTLLCDMRLSGRRPNP